MSAQCILNDTAQDITLQGFKVNQQKDILLSIVFIFLYILTILGNSLIITTVCLQPSIQKPMYYFLSNFSAIEMCYTTSFMPWIITSLATGFQRMSLICCIIQLYFFITFGTFELFLLTVMAFDRYQAICNPLHYMEIMTANFCNCLMFGCGLVVFLFNFPVIFLMQGLDFRRSNVINHFLCDGPALLQLSCSDTRLTNIILLIISAVTMVPSFIITLSSYAWVIHTILGLSTLIGRSKAFSTCSSHLTAAGIYYSTLIFIYVQPHSFNTYNINKVVSVFYTIIIPLLNPLIYTLRNKEFKQAMRKLTR